MDVGENPVSDIQLRGVLRELKIAPGDQEAWKRLYCLMWPFVFSVSFRALGDARDLAEDASQEVFLRLARYGAEWKITEPKDFRGYLSTIARNVCRSLLKRVSESIGWLELPDNISSEADQEGSIAAFDLRNRLARGLDARDQKLIDLIIDEASVAEIAEAMHLTYGATAVRIHRLRRKLGSLKKPGGL